jgi:hypothetical protein
MTIPQWEQDEIHEMVDAGLNVRAIIETTGYTAADVVRCAGRLSAWKTGRLPSPYLPGTRLPEPPGTLEGKLKRKRLDGGTDGQQVM